MSDSKKMIAVAVIAGLIVATIVAILAVFYEFHGRLSRLEAQSEIQSESLSEIKSAISSLNSQTRFGQYYSMDGFPIPVPSAEQPVGGRVAVIDTFPASNPNELTLEQVLNLLDPIVDPAALVNMVLAKIVKLEEVRLVSLDNSSKKTGDAKYAAIMKIRNLTDQDVSFSIPSGQVFENQETGTNRQNIAAARNLVIQLEPRQALEITVDSHCLNKGRDRPNGSPGNITVFKVRDFDSDGQNALWSLVEQKVGATK